MVNPEEIEKIVEDAKKYKDEEEGRNKTMFFRIVMCGNTNVANQVLNHVKESKNEESEELYKWLTKTPCTNNQCPPEKINKFLKFMFLIPVWIILTPIFYLFHSFINAILTSKQAAKYFSISDPEKLDFPLAFAVFSEEYEMVKLFLNHGVNIDDKDTKGNNVMHYIADLSAYDLEKAEQCYKMLWKMAKKRGQVDEKTLCKMIADDENIHKQNALECCCQFGGLKLACQMIHDTKTTHELIVERNEDFVSLDQGEMCSEKARTISNGGIAKRMMIQCGNENKTRHGFASYILHLINFRHTISVSEENWTAVLNDAGLQKWMKCKFQQLIWPIGVTMFIELSITVICFCK